MAGVTALASEATLARRLLPAARFANLKAALPAGALADFRASMGYAARRESGVRCPPRRRSWCGRSGGPSGAVGAAGGGGAGDGGVGAGGQREDGPAAVLDQGGGASRAGGVGT